MSFPRYPAYKHSGVEWLGEVPEHWELSRLGFESWVRARLGWKGLKAEEYVDSGFAFLSTPNIKGRLIDFSNVNYIDIDRYDESPEIKLSSGDVLLAKDGSTLGIANVVRTLPVSATVNSSIAVITPCAKLDSIYLYYLLCGSGMQQLIQQKKGGMGVPHLFQSDLVKFAIPIPASNEQCAIATFLDRETAKIDALIAEQQRLIELLQEKRQAVISHAVTKGLNPDVPMKDSGVEWLGEVPEHWDVQKLKTFASFTGGGTPSRENLNFWNGAIPWVSPKDMKFEKIIQTEEGITQEGLNGSTSSLVSPGHVLLVVRSGILKHTLPVAINDIELALNQDMKAVLLKETVCTSAFFLRWIQGLNDHLVLAWAKQGATVESIEQEYLANSLIPLPSLSEQSTIATFLDRETAKIDALIAEQQVAITLLQERRSVLISAAVTGQIDVRGLVPEAEPA